MADKTVIELCGVNIVASPHPNGIYPELLSRVADVEANVWGSDYAKITPLTQIEDKPDLYVGRILVWTHIDKKKPWIDKKKNKEALERDKEKIIIPQQLDPNFRAFHFALIESRHRLIFEVRNELGDRFGPSRALSLFSSLFSPGILGDDAPDVSVTVVPEDGSIDRIFKIPRLKKLEIHLERPNPDDLTDDVNRILEELEGQGAKKQEVILTKAPHVKSLSPNGETRILAEVAALNGYVSGTGNDEEGGKIDESTREHPKKIRVELAPNQSSFARFLSHLGFF